MRSKQLVVVEPGRVELQAHEIDLPDSSLSIA